MKKLILIAVILLACAKRQDSRADYEVEMIYSPERHVIPSSVTKKWKDQVKDSIVLFFESGFVNDEVRIVVNSRKIYVHLTSDEIIQFARFIPVASVTETAPIRVQINGGRILSITPNSGIRYVAINFHGNKIMAQVLDEFPYYD